MLGWPSRGILFVDRAQRTLEETVSGETITGPRAAVVVVDICTIAVTWTPNLAFDASVISEVDAFIDIDVFDGRIIARLCWKAGKLWRKGK